mmetsp:Transcript_1791/g.7074  ORF Transcript_1791/g.7074 Transcript_1791/m.7074 type:complete len:225 (+) Transcript_1791:774-1448(+)
MHRSFRGRKSSSSFCSRVSANMSSPLSCDTGLWSKSSSSKLRLSSKSSRGSRSALDNGPTGAVLACLPRRNFAKLLKDNRGPPGSSGSPVLLVLLSQDRVPSTVSPVELVLLLALFHIIPNDMRPMRPLTPCSDRAVKPSPERRPSRVRRPSLRLLFEREVPRPPPPKEVLGEMRPLASEKFPNDSHPRTEWRPSSTSPSSAGLGNAAPPEDEAEPALSIKRNF